jgi:predicted secreted hydrolase
MNRSIWLRIFLLFVLFCTAGCNPQAELKSKITGLPVQLGDPTAFTRAAGPRVISFPHDHGPHNDFQTEWWYYTGNLSAADGHQFGYQLTFFRRAIVSPGEQSDRSSDWAVQQVYLAHFALTEIDAGRFHAFERLERGAAGLAGAVGDPQYGVWLHDWMAQQTGDSRYTLKAAEGDISVNLDMKELKAPVLQGDRGYSQKGPEPGNASYYYSLTRLDTTGEVSIGQNRMAVSGLSWMDHEFSTSALSPDLVGWDWYALQLDNQTELMIYSLRKSDGSLSPFSRGILVRADGTTRTLAPADFQIRSGKTWRSPHSGAVYPATWEISIPSEEVQIQVTPATADQELNLSFVYWEGAVVVNGSIHGSPVKGKGYTELTGYARSMQGQF